uniref:Uncharacterized protein n=1 Tax=Picea glauca TaxID=3330 RepID=A0A101LW28_PICGL|nr:hypothetical protein ABT39_MTgene1525 [Picea glauca]
MLRAIELHTNLQLVDKHMYLHRALNLLLAMVL